MCICEIASVAEHSEGKNCFAVDAPKCEMSDAFYGKFYKVA